MAGVMLSVSGWRCREPLWVFGMINLTVGFQESQKVICWGSVHSSAFALHESWGCRDRFPSMGDQLFGLGLPAACVPLVVGQGQLPALPHSSCPAHVQGITQHIHPLYSSIFTKLPSIFFFLKREDFISDMCWTKTLDLCFIPCDGFLSCGGTKCPMYGVALQLQALFRVSRRTLRNHQSFLKLCNRHLQGIST